MGLSMLLIVLVNKRVVLHIIINHEAVWEILGSLFFLFAEYTAEPPVATRIAGESGPVESWASFEIR